jgi:hypothetical protein
MYGLWRKSLIPQPNRRRKAMQVQNATFPSSRLVAALKQPHPHKEQRLKVQILLSRPTSKYYDTFITENSLKHMIKYLFYLALNYETNRCHLGENL